MKKIPILASLASIMSVAAPVHGQAENEGVCDELKADGVTKGLYGLCLAVCGDPDCDPEFNPSTGEATFGPECRPSNSTLLDRYVARMTASDPYPPCVNVSVGGCLCWSEEEIDALAPAVNGCFDSSPLSVAMNGYDNGAREIAFVQTDPSTGQGYCFYSAQNPPVSRFFGPMTPEESAACHQSLLDEMTSRGCL